MDMKEAWWVLQEWSGDQYWVQCTAFMACAFSVFTKYTNQQMTPSGICMQDSAEVNEFLWSPTLLAIKGKVWMTHQVSEQLWPWYSKGNRALTWLQHCCGFQVVLRRYIDSLKIYINYAIMNSPKSSVGLWDSPGFYRWEREASERLRNSCVVIQWAVEGRHKWVCKTCEARQSCLRPPDYIWL